MRFIPTFIALLTTAPVAAAEPLPVAQGSYMIRYRLELPHVERWAIERRATVCVSDRIPVLSGNMPFANCVLSKHRFDGGRYSFDVNCAGRDSARAIATYVLKEGGFEGRIAMVMGAKNMTMTEVQSARRLGRCHYAGGE